ncbi:MAG: 23S rRNA (pseudouridine(1915)-N(3))-methyltransferase RlmH [Pseudomonadota bacterium]
MSARLLIAAVGKARTGPEAELTDDYLKRAAPLGARLGFKGPDLIEVDAPRGLSGPKRAAKEAELLLNAAGEASLIALDETGRDMGSEAIAAMLSEMRDAGAPAIAFAIGGADGHGAPLIAKSARKIAFGKATWPHLLVRAMLAEQLYRAMTILAGHPYHRA